MTVTKSKITTGIMMLSVFLILAIGGCKKDSPPRSTTYQLKTKDQLGVLGTVTFTEVSSTSTSIAIVLTGSDATEHPAHIHKNAAVEGGSIAVNLNPVNNGNSTTVVTADNNGIPLSYSQLIAYDGYINVHESSTNMVQIIAQGDIGGNAITTSNKSYVLSPVGAFGVSGTVLFEKRVNGNTLATISLSGTIAGGMLPAAIHLGSVTTVGGGPVEKTLNPVDGATGKSYTNIRTLDDLTVITYDNILVYDGYLAVQESSTLNTTVCQGNIGTH